MRRRRLLFLLCSCRRRVDASLSRNRRGTKYGRHSRLWASVTVEMGGNRPPCGGSSGASISVLTGRVENRPTVLPEHPEGALRKRAGVGVTHGSFLAEAIITGVAKWLASPRSGCRLPTCCASGGRQNVAVRLRVEDGDQRHFIVHATALRKPAFGVA